MSTNDIIKLVEESEVSRELIDELVIALLERDNEINHLNDMYQIFDG